MRASGDSGIGPCDESVSEWATSLYAIITGRYTGNKSKIQMEYSGHNRVCGNVAQCTRLPTPRQTACLCKRLDKHLNGAAARKADGCSKFVSDAVAYQARRVLLQHLKRRLHNSPFHAAAAHGTDHFAG